MASSCFTVSLLTCSYILLSLQVLLQNQPREGDKKHQNEEENLSYEQQDIKTHQWILWIWAHGMKGNGAL